MQRPDVVDRDRSTTNEFCRISPYRIRLDWTNPLAPRDCTHETDDVLVESIEAHRKFKTAADVYYDATQGHGSTKKLRRELNALAHLHGCPRFDQTPVDADADNSGVGRMGTFQH